MSRFSERMRHFEADGPFVVRRAFTFEGKRLEPGQPVEGLDGRRARRLWMARLIDCAPAPAPEAAPEPKAEEKPKKAPRRQKITKPAPAPEAEEKPELPSEEGE